jgi:hypothetical protein
LWHTRGMPKQVKQSKRPSDVNELAHRLVELSTSQSDTPSVPVLPEGMSDYMAAIGRKGGQIGGKRRLKTMTKAERSKVATKAAKVRWSKKKHK